MNALEKLGYVKQPNHGDIDVYEKRIIHGNYCFEISIGTKSKPIKKALIFKEETTEYAEFITQAELKAILELMEETE